MANLTAFNAQTLAAVKASTPNAINIVFNQLLKKSTASTTNVFHKLFMGPDGKLGYPCCKISDLTKTAGDTVHFTKHGGFRQAPVLGEADRNGKEAKPVFGTHKVVIDFQWFGAAYTRKMIRQMAAGDGVMTAVVEELNNTQGALLTDFGMQRLLQRSVASWNIFYPNGRQSVAALTKTDVFSPTIIERAAARAATLGTKPISNAKLASGVQIPKYLYFAPNDVLQSLFADTAWLNRGYYSEDRGKMNTFTEGGFADWRGQTIFNWNVVDEDQNTGPIGSFFNPKAKLGVAVTTGTAAVVLYGGGAGYDSGAAVAADYFRHFSGNISFLQYEGEVLAADTNDYFVVVWNHIASSNGGDAGKWGFYRYIGSTGNAGTTITTAAYSATTSRKGGRLSATANGGGADTRDTTVGNIAWSASLNTEYHPVGAPMFLANANGDIIGYVGLLGSESLLYGFGGGAMGDPSSSIGMWSNYKPKGADIQGSVAFEDRQQVGMKIQNSVELVTGCDVALDTQGLPRNYIMIPVVYVPPEIGNTGL